MRMILSNIRGFFFLVRQAITGSEKTFTTGSINRAIVLLSVPMVLEMVMESLFVCVNLFFISKLGEGSVAIIGATESVTSLAYSVSIGLGIAASAIVSRRVGEKKYKAAGHSGMQIIYISILISVFLSIACFIFYEQLLSMIGLSEYLIQEGEWYIKMIFVSIAFVITRISVNGVFRGSGDAAIAMRTLWLTNIVNMVLSPIFIFGWGPLAAMGLPGAGLAALIARVLALAYQLFFLVRGKTIVKIGLPQLTVDVALMKRIVKLASSGALQYVIPASSWMLMIKIVSYFGSAPLAGYIIAQRVTSIATMPAWGVGNAAGILTGQNLGANQVDRAEKSVWKAGTFNMYFLLLVAFVWWFFAEPVVRLFSQVPEVLNNGVMYIHYISVAYVLLAYTMVISRALNASGNVKLVTFLYIIMFYVIQLPLAYMLGIRLNWGPEGIFTAMLASEIVLAISCIIAFKKGGWKNRKV